MGRLMAGFFVTCLAAATALLAVAAAHWDDGRADPAAPLTVHMVAHSHCDAGYRKSFEQYYTTEVSSILNTMLAALSDPTAASMNRTFVWEEVSYLRRWWEDAATTADQLATFLELEQKGRLELIGGGFVMHDEATTSLEPLLNQFYTGLDWLLGNIGVRPQFGWHIGTPRSRPPLRAPSAHMLPCGIR
jgi:hypothetical protein